MPRIVCCTGPRAALVLACALLATLCFASSAGARAEYRGVQLHSLWPGSSTADMDRELDLAEQAGANAVRIDVAWSSLETNAKGRRSQWYVDKLDRFMAGAESRGMKVIATLWSTPCWASSAPATAKLDCTGAWWDRGVTAHPPTSAGDYADAARWVTERYGAKLAALEVWNEPNLEGDSFWAAPDKAGAYATLVKAAYPAAKAGNPNVPVLAGALSFADAPFLDALYAHGIKGFADGISVHPYNEWRDPGDLWQPQYRKWTLVSGLDWIRQRQRAAGDANPIWITEFGWTTGTNTRWHVTEGQQALYTRRAFPVLDGLPYVKASLLYNLRNKNSDPADQEGNFGVVTRDFRPKPAYAALKEGLTGNARRAAPTRLTLRTRRRNGVIYAVGTAPARQVVQLRLLRCRQSTWRPLIARSSARSRFSHRLGRVGTVTGCRVQAQLARARAARLTVA